MPVEFIREICTDYNGYVVCDSTKLIVAYDGSGRRISKTRLKKTAFDGPWYAEHVTHYTGIGTEVRENFAGPAKETKVVVNMPVFFRVTLTRLKPRSYIEKDILRLSNGGAILPKQSFGASRQGLGRYGIEDADHVAENGSAQTFEWFLKNHLGSTMLVYGSGGGLSGGLQAAYDYRSFGEQITMTSPSTGKVTENFTGKERDDEIALDYFGARYLDPMLGMWISVDPMRQFASPYLYAGNGVNPVNGVDGDGGIIHLANNQMQLLGYINQISATQYTLNERNELIPTNISKANGTGNQYYSDRLNAAIESSDVLEVLVGSIDETYLNNYTGVIECEITGKFNRNSSPAQNLLHELVGHGIPVMLDDRDPTASAVEEEQKAVDGVFPVDVPDHMIDQRYEE